MERLTGSQEDYLEAVLVLVRKGRVARVRDIARALGVGMPSVTTALKSLARRGLVNYDPYQFITLTDAGRDLAEEVSQRHNVLRRFLIEVLGLDPESAEANACRMEHAVDRRLLERLMDFAEFIRACPRAGESWIGAFLAHGPRGREPHRCRACLAGMVRQFRAAAREG